MTLHRGDQGQQQMATGGGSPPQAQEYAHVETLPNTPPSSSSSSRSPPGVSSSGARKKLPSIPVDGMQQLSLNRTPDGKVASPKGVQSYGPFFLEYSLMAEYNQLQKQKLPGVYVIPSANSPLCWNGVLFIRQGYYQEGIFRFTLHIPENYPDGDCPKVIFEPAIYHPVINPETGELDVKRAFQKWRRNVNHIWQVLVYARRIFYKIDTQTPLNPEAAVLFDHDSDVFKSKVAQTIKMCKDKMYDPPNSDDPHAIRFSPWNPEIHEELHKEMLHPKESSPSEGGKNAQTSGLSWMMKGSSSIFSYNNDFGNDLGSSPPGGSSS